MRISQKGIDLIKHFEGLELAAYRDSVGVLTIGYGHTGADVKPGMEISTAEAERLLKDDLARFEMGVMDLVKVPLKQGQFDALVSFAFNLGLGNLKSSTLLRKLNAGDASGASYELQRWVYAGKEKLAGLVRRRETERVLFLS